MTLAAKLEAIYAGAATRVPADKRAIMAQFTADQRASGIADGAIKAGDTLPAFALPNQKGETVRSGDLLAQGPVVLTVFRGVW